MKINYVIEDFSVCGGIERIVSRKASILAARYGHDVTIISIYKDNRPIRYPLDESIKVVRLDVPWTEKTANPVLMTLHRVKTLIKAAKRLNKALKTTEPDIVFFTTTLGALLLPLCRTKAKTVFESHLARKFTPYNTFFKLTELKSDAIVCLTSGDAKEYKTARRIEVIPNFIDKPKSYVKDYAVKHAVAVGRLEHQKGFDRLISCWKAAVKTRPGWRLDIYGEGPLRDELQRQIDSFRLQETIKLRGTCADITDRYALYSLHLMTSRYEGQGIVLIEAQAAGLPSVVFDYEYGAADIVTDGVNGFLVPQNDTKTFTNRLVQIMDSENLRAKFGTEAKENVKTFFTENIMWKWEEFIKKTTNKQNG